MNLDSILTDKTLCNYTFCVNDHIYFKFLDIFDNCEWHKTLCVTAHSMIYAPIKIKNILKNTTYITLGNFIISKNSDLPVKYSASIQNGESLINVISIKKFKENNYDI